MSEHVIVVDLGYGDAGKGTIVDWLCASAKAGIVSRANAPANARSNCATPPNGTISAHAGQSRAGQGRAVPAVVRFNGGAQAAHHVLAPDGVTPHAFAQFGSGTFTAGTRTFLSRFMLVDLLALVAEAEHLGRLGVPGPLGLVAVDRDALLTTPYHRLANQAREAARGDRPHGSCGLGIGETASYALDCPADAPRAGDLTSPRRLRAKLAKLRAYLADAAGSGAAGAGGAGAGAAGKQGPPPDDLAEVYRDVAGRLTLAGDGHLRSLLGQGPVVFEGAQGVLLDEWRGFHPYTTWSTTTYQNAETLLAEAGTPRGAVRLGVTRTYQTRHGPGPFPTEDRALRMTESHNAAGRWQGPFRVGHLDAVALRYAAEVTGGVDAVALTHLDVAAAHPELRVCRRYVIDGREVARIEPGPPCDLAHQEALTESLLRARPVYDEVTDWPAEVSGILHAPVTVRSHGPRPVDKLASPLVTV